MTKAIQTFKIIDTIAALIELSSPIYDAPLYHTDRMDLTPDAFRKRKRKRKRKRHLAYLLPIYVLAYRLFPFYSLSLHVLL